jgi:hypothetical protein
MEERHGYTSAQRFFLTFAQNWCAAGTPEMWQRLAKGDSHAWEAPHVKGLLPNLPEFAQAFACRAGQPMVKPPEQIYGQGRPPQRLQDGGALVASLEAPCKGACDGFGQCPTDARACC